MKFIKIFERINGEGTVTLTKVVDTKLTQEQYQDLMDYFDEATDEQWQSTICIEDEEVFTIEVINHDELLEDSPLPDGTIVLAKEFKEDGTYAICMGDMDKAKIIGVHL